MNATASACFCNSKCSSDGTSILLFDGARGPSDVGVLKCAFYLSTGFCASPYNINLHCRGIGKNADGKMSVSFVWIIVLTFGLFYQSKLGVFAFRFSLLLHYYICIYRPYSPLNMTALQITNLIFSLFAKFISSRTNGNVSCICWNFVFLSVDWPFFLYGFLNRRSDTHTRHAACIRYWKKVSFVENCIECDTRVFQ